MQACEKQKLGYNMVAKRSGCRLSTGVNVCFLLRGTVMASAYVVVLCQAGEQQVGAHNSSQRGIGF